MNNHLFISGVFIVGVNDWQFTFIDDSCYLLVIVLVTLDVDFKVLYIFGLGICMLTWYEMLVLE